MDNKTSYNYEGMLRCHVFTTNIDMSEIEININSH